MNGACQKVISVSLPMSKIKNAHECIHMNNIILHFLYLCG